MRSWQASSRALSPLILMFAVCPALPAGAQVCMVHELQELSALDHEVDYRFSESMAMSGERLVVAALLAASETEAHTGAAYVFRIDDNATPEDPTDDSWVQEAKLTASDGIAYDYFGFSVAMDGDRVVVGAPWSGIEAIFSGSAYVFRRDDNDTPVDPSDDFWVEEDKLTAPGAVEFDQFGDAVAISGDRIVVGATFDDHEVADAGSAYVFRRNDNGTPLDPRDDFWVDEDMLTAPDAATNDNFGQSVAIRGDWVIVGAFSDDDACPPELKLPNCASGSAYTFRRSDNGTPLNPGDDFWVYGEKLTVPDAERRDEFARSISMSANRVVFGASQEIFGGLGSAYVFRRNDGGTPQTPDDDEWVQEAKLVASNRVVNSRFGRSVFIDSDRIVVGARIDDGDRIDTGAAYVFRRYDNGTPLDAADDYWVQEFKLAAASGVASDRFGQSVAIGGERVVVGARLHLTGGSFRGTAYSFSPGQVCTDLPGYADFQRCFTGAGGGVPPGCESFNLDPGDDIALNDFREFLRTFSGP